MESWHIWKTGIRRKPQGENEPYDQFQKRKERSDAARREAAAARRAAKQEVKEAEKAYADELKRRRAKEDAEMRQHIDSYVDPD